MQFSNKHQSPKIEIKSVWAKTISCKFVQICATENASLQLEIILCKLTDLYNKKNSKEAKQFDACLDWSVQQKILRCSREKFYARFSFFFSLEDGSKLRKIFLIKADANLSSLSIFSKLYLLMISEAGLCLMKFDLF